ncbi:MAG: DUF932 domain-containing protein [Methylococcales bacterium]|nr:DUF932 domain-containing protein [Methylococcales bacterium]
MQTETEIKREIKTKEILIDYGLDWKIEKRALVDITEIEKDPLNPMLMPEKTPFFSLRNMSNGQHLHSVKNGYTVSQNEDLVYSILKGTEAFGNIKPIFGASIRGGRKVMLQFELEGKSYVNDDMITQYITGMDSNDGSAGFAIGIGDKTASCKNQFFHFYKSAFAKVRHSATLEQKLKELPMMIEQALLENMKMINLYKDFASVPIHTDNYHKMVNKIIGIDATLSNEDLKVFSTQKKNSMNKLYKCIQIETSTKGQTLWGLHSGVTRYTTHHRSVPNREHGRLESQMVGTAYRENHKSLEYAKAILNEY